MKKIIFILLFVLSLPGFSNEYSTIVDNGVKISKKEIENNNKQIVKAVKNKFSQDNMIKEFLQLEPEGYRLYYVGKWDVLTKNIEISIKSIRYVSTKKALINIKIISPDPDN